MLHNATVGVESGNADAKPAADFVKSPDTVIVWGNYLPHYLLVMPNKLIMERMFVRILTHQEAKSVL